MSNRTREEEEDIDTEYRNDHASDLIYEREQERKEAERGFAIHDPLDILDQYPHAEDCEDFAELIPSGMIGSATGDWGFCPFCGDYI